MNALGKQDLQIARYDLSLLWLPFPNPVFVFPGGWILHSAAKLLTKRWRLVADAICGKTPQPAHGMTQEQLDKAVELSTISTSIHTWRQLFHTCKRMEEEKMASFGKRSRELTSEAQASKKRVQQRENQPERTPRYKCCVCKFIKWRYCACE